MPGRVTCVCGALAIYLWFAPPTFWQRLLAIIRLSATLEKGIRDVRSHVSNP
jgi:hypothetical protein